MLRRPRRLRGSCGRLCPPHQAWVQDPQLWRLSKGRNRGNAKPFVRIRDGNVQLQVELGGETESGSSICLAVRWRYQELARTKVVGLLRSSVCHDNCLCLVIQFGDSDDKGGARLWPRLPEALGEAAIHDVTEGGQWKFACGHLAALPTMRAKALRIANRLRLLCHASCARSRQLRVVALH